MKSKKIQKRIISLAVTFALVLGMLPIVGRPLHVYAESSNKSIACLGTEALTHPLVPKDDTEHWAGSFVYLGKYNDKPVKYRVLDPDTTRFGSRTMFLDCHEVLYAKQYDSTPFGPWTESNLYKELNTNSDSFLNTSFTSTERGAIAESTVGSHELAYESTEEGAVNVDDFVKECFDVYTPLNGEKIFFLDVEDVSNNAYGYESRGSYSLSRLKSDHKSWWLRSKDMRPDIKEERYGASDEYKWITPLWFINPNGISPALNVDLGKTVFSSVVSGTAGQTNAEYKLTLLDPDMTLSMDKGVKKKGSLVTIPYTITNNSAENVPTQVSAVVTDGMWTESGWSEGASILQYTKLDVESFGLTGTGSFTLDESITGDWGKDYHVYILAEDVREGINSDYASEPVEIHTIDASSKGFDGEYDKTPRDIAVYVKSPTSGSTVKYGDYEGTYAYSSSPRITDVGEKTVYYQVSAPNCLDFTGSETIKINKKDLYINAETKSMVYGDPVPELTYTSEGLIEGDKITGELQRSSNLDAGIYTINQGTLSAGDNYNIIYSGALFYISPADSSVLKAPEVVDGLVYNGDEQALVTPGSGTGGVMKYAVTDSDTHAAPAANKFDAETPTAKNAGSYHVWYKVAGDMNHVDSKPKCLTVSIEKLEASLSWSDTYVTYNGEVQTPKAVVSNKVEGDDLALTVTGGEKNVGVYTATVSEMTGEDVDNYKLPKKIDQIFSISKATPELDVSIEDWTYGDFANAPEVTGVPEGEDVTIEYKAYGAKKSTYTQAVPTKAGMYNIRASVKGDGNYTAVSVEDSFTISPKEVSLEWGETTFIYDKTDKCPEVEIRGLEEEDEGKVVADVYGASSSVGTHTARVLALTGDAASNYKLPADAKVTFTIKEADKEALITAVSEAETYLDSIKDNTDYAPVAAELKIAIVKANAVIENDMVTENAIGDAIIAIENAKTTAEEEVAEIDREKEEEREREEHKRKEKEEHKRKEKEEQEKKEKEEQEKKEREEQEKKEKEEQEKKEKEEQSKKEEDKKEDRKEEKKDSDVVVGSWHSDANGWWYEFENGDYPKNEWKQIDGAWYYFKADGYMAANEWCDGWWCDADGVCRYAGQGTWKSDASGFWFEDTTGWFAAGSWQKIDNHWYYFKANGYMATSQYVDGYWINADGTMVE